jgi:hypothetical protein
MKTNENCENRKMLHISYTFKNEKKRHFLQLNNSISKTFSGELKKLILNSSTCEEHCQILILDSETNLLMKDEDEINPGKHFIIERIPWYKSQHFSTKLTSCLNEKELFQILGQIRQEELIKQLQCKMCHKLDCDNEILMTQCCGESACSKCLGKYSQNVHLIKDAFINNCPFCFKEFISENKIMVNHKIKDFNTLIMKFLSQRSHDGDDIHSNLNHESNYKITPHNNELFNYHLNTEITHDTTITSPISPKQNMTPSQNFFNLCLNVYPNNIYLAPSPDHIISENNPHFRLFENSRFFIIKSSNIENIKISRTYDEWATTLSNQKKLNDAFQHNNVILLFSVNKSGIFSGYAIMKSFISNKVSELWTNEYSVRLGGTFKVQWLVSCDLPFNRVKHMLNPLNNSEPVVKSRDTQELSKDLGVQICHLAYEQENIEVKSNRSWKSKENICGILEEIKCNRENGTKFIQKNCLLFKADTTNSNINLRKSIILIMQ